MSQTIINDVPPYTQAVASAGQVTFDTNWTANFASDVIVYQTPAGDDPDDSTQILAYPSQYTVTFVGALLQVRVTLATGAAIGDIITMTRMTPADRENLYSNTNFTPSMLNNDFGILTLVDQQAQLVNQMIAPRYNYSAQINSNLIYPTRDTILPLLGPNQFWAMNGSQSAIEALDITSIISGGTVTQVNTGLGLTGGPITNAGTISFGPMAANSFWGNITGGSALPTEVPTTYFAKTANNLSDLTDIPQARINLGLEIGVDVQPYSAKLTSIAGLSLVQNDLLYVTSASTFGLIAAANNSVLVTGVSGIPSLSTTLPQAVQTNIQYLGTQNQALNMGGFQITNGADPTQPSDFATKNYVDLTALTGTSVYAASAASLGTVTQSGSGVGATLTNAGAQATFALDGVNPPAGSNVLIKDTATGMTAANEGIYTVTNAGSGATNWVLTRATTYDTPTEINQTGLIIVQNGSTLAGTAWYNSVTIVTVDVTSFSYSQFGNITFPVSLAHGGTNANLTAVNGGIVYSNSTAMAISAAGSSGQLLQSGGAGAPTWTTATFPVTAGTAGKILISDGTNYITSTSIWPNTVGSAGKLLISDGTSNVYTTPLWPTTGGAVGSIVISDGTNKINSTSLWPNTVGSAGKIIRSDGTVNAYSTATYPDTAGTSGNVMTSDGTNFVSSTPTSFTLIGKQVLSGTGTYTPTAGTKYVWVRGQAGGGGGGGANGGANVSGGGGGGSGAYGELWEAATSRAYAVGAGGAGGVGAATGTTGGDTTFGTAGAQLNLGGGVGGASSAGAGILALGGNGGAATTAQFGIAGGKGSFANGTAALFFFSGGGANSRLGAGGPGAAGGSTVGIDATGFGAGGGGAVDNAATSRNGGAGSAGTIVVFEFG